MKTTLLVLCSAFALVGSVSAKVTEKFTQNYPLEVSGTIRLQNVNGSIEIVAWDQPGVALEAEKSADTQEGIDRMHLKIESTPGLLAIKTDLEKKWRFWDHMNAQVHYKLRVPAGVTLDKIEAVNANITVTGVTSPVHLGTVNGSIAATGLCGAGKFGSVNGSIQIGYATMPATGGIALETVNGSCTLTLPKRAAFNLDTDTVNGHVDCAFPITLEKSGRHELRGAVNGGGTRVELESVNGGLKVEQAG